MKISTSIKHFSLLFFFLGILASCQNSGPINSDVPAFDDDSETIHSKKIDNSKKKVAELSRESAVVFLEEFGKENLENRAVISTPHGEIKVKLYKSTPLHRANFVYLAQQQYFDGTWFHRVSENHVIQAGNNDEQATVNKRTQLGDYRIPSEMEAGHLHQKYALAAARRYGGNSDKESFPYEFYIVLGKTYSPRQLDLLGEKHEINFSQRQKDFYSKTPGSPHLDGQHTVFGIVTEGREIVDEISLAETDEGEWPLKNIPIKVTVF